MIYTHKTEQRYVRLICYECRELTNGRDDGERFLTHEQYNQQMKDPNKGWRCPLCRTYPCGFDDEYFELPLEA